MTSAAGAAPPKVMIVDDDPSFCDSMVDILNLEGYAPLIANRCSEALEIAAGEKPNIVLLDFKLPDGEGTGLIADLKAQNPNCVCIIITAYADLDAALTALDRGAYHFLKKPFQPPELLGLLQRAFETVLLREEKRAAEEALKTRNEELEQMIAGQKRLEAQLIQTQKLEAIGTLAGGVAHDFNNVLAGIIGYTELALLNLNQISDVKAFLNKSLEASKRAKELIDQILAFSHKAEKELKPILLGPILKEALRFLRATLPTTINIVGEIEPHSGTVMADVTQIHRIMMNLCTNAGHAMQRNGGTLTVSLSPLSGDQWRKADSRLHKIPSEPCLKLSIKDTGEGIHPDILERIFDPYFTTKEKGEGTGLGLAVVQGIVESYGGVIEVASQLGRGTVFHIYLPLVAVDIETAEQEESSQLQGGSECILLVDDEPNLIEIGSQMLSYLGYRVETATSSTSALELFRQDPRRFDLVITDMTMPQLTGDVLAQAMMRIKPELPVILCTGYNEKITPEKAAGLGLRGFVMKPIELSVMAAAVRKALDTPS